MKLLVVSVFRQNFAFKPNIDFNVERKSSLVIMTQAHIKMCIGVVDFRFNFVTTNNTSRVCSLNSTILTSYSMNCI